MTKSTHSTPHHTNNVNDDPNANWQEKIDSKMRTSFLGTEVVHENKKSCTPSLGTNAIWEESIATRNTPCSYALERLDERNFDKTVATDAGPDQPGTEGYTREERRDKAAKVLNREINAFLKSPTGRMGRNK